MALSFALNNAGFTADAIDTEAASRSTRSPTAWTITAIHLTTRARVPRIDAAKFAEIAARRQGELSRCRGCSTRRSRWTPKLVRVTTSMPDPHAADQGPRRDLQSRQPLSARRARSRRRRLGAARSGDEAIAPPPPKHDGHDPALAHDHRAQRLARHPVHAVDQSVPGLRARLHLLLTRVRRTPTSTCRRGSTSRPSSSPSPMPPSCCARSSPSRAIVCDADRDGHQHRSVPADRARMEDHAPGPRGAVARASTRFPSSPSRRWSSATSTCSRRWRRRIWRASTSSITTLDRELARTLEPRAASPQRRLAAVQGAGDAGIPVGVMTAPIIPQLTDKDMEAILEAAAAQRRAIRRDGRCCGCRSRSRTLFRDWLAAALSAARRARHEHRSSRCAADATIDPDSARACGAPASSPTLIAKRFEIACRRFGLNHDQTPCPNRSHVRAHDGARHVARFRPPRREGARNSTCSRSALFRCTPWRRAARSVASETVTCTADATFERRRTRTTEPRKCAPVVPAATRQCRLRRVLD